MARIGDQARPGDAAWAVEENGSGLHYGDTERHSCYATIIRNFMSRPNVVMIAMLFAAVRPEVATGW